MSRYSKLLTKIIAESGYTAKEIVDKCNEIGNRIDTTRLSKLQNGKLPAPSEKVSRDIANICKADERQLVIEGYIEKAPKEIVDVLLTLKSNVVTIGFKAFENHITKEQMEIIKEKLEQEPLSDLLIEILDSKVNKIDIISNEIDINSKNFNFKLEEPLALKIEDNAMFPIIPEGAKISLKIEDRYKHGDIVAIKIKGKEKLIARQIFIMGRQIVLTSLNKDYENETYNSEDIVILGKVIKVVYDIQN